MMRHGESDSNAQNIVSYKPEDKMHLTEKGRVRALASANALKEKGVDLIISSPVLRTRETASIVAETLGIAQDAIIYDERITEVNTGDFSGCAIETYREYFTSTLEKFTKPSPNGENLEQMKTRIAEFLYDIDERYKGKTILIVTHEYGTWMMDAVARGATNVEAAWMRSESGDDYVNYAEVKPLLFAPLPHNERFELDFHRPFIDAVQYHCSCELGTKSRIPEVFDCWFESGSMPFAQFHYMGDETTLEGKLFVKNFPADFIAEGVDQTRGWFYTMLILSVALFDRAAFRSVITTGQILAEDGAKMSKRLKNYPDPMEVAVQYGADALRFYIINSPVVRGEDLRFTTLGVDEVYKKVTLRLDNVRSFYLLHAGTALIPQQLSSRTNVLDKWIVARWQETHAEVTHYLDTHELDRATRPIMPFLDDLSTWYLRRSRDRFKSADLDALAAVETTGWILLQVSKLLAPFMPFLAEDLYQKLGILEKKESVHLESWPTMGVSIHTILEEMEMARKIVEISLGVRAESGLKVRQPLQALHYAIKGKNSGLSDAMQMIIADEVNVKELLFDEEIMVTVENNSSYHVAEAGGVTVALDTLLTPPLIEEGAVRDLIRSIQDLRKKAGLNPSDRVTLTIPMAQFQLVQKNATTIKEVVGATAVTEGEKLQITKVSE